MRFHGYFRSSAAFRVRIALNLKGLDPEYVFRHLRRNEQNAPDFLALNPQGLVPRLRQMTERCSRSHSRSSNGWTRPSPIRRCGPATHRSGRESSPSPLPLPATFTLCRTSRCSTACASWGRMKRACRIGRLGESRGTRGLRGACKGGNSPFLFGHAPSLADICLVPQLANARRFKVDVSAFPRLLSVEAACLALPAFQQALPQNQPDFEP